MPLILICCPSNGDRRKSLFHLWTLDGANVGVGTLFRPSSILVWIVLPMLLAGFLAGYVDSRYVYASIPFWYLSGSAVFFLYAITVPDQWGLAFAIGTALILAGVDKTKIYWLQAAGLIGAVVLLALSVGISNTSRVQSVLVLALAWDIARRNGSFGFWQLLFIGMASGATVVAGIHETAGRTGGLYISSLKFRPEFLLALSALIGQGVGAYLLLFGIRRRWLWWSIFALITGILLVSGAGYDGEISKSDTVLFDRPRTYLIGLGACWMLWQLWRSQWPLVYRFAVSRSVRANCSLCRCYRLSTGRPQCQKLFILRPCY